MPSADNVELKKPRAPGKSFACRLTWMLVIVCVGNAAAWLWAILAFRYDPALLGLALLVYGLGLRHAMDGDHIAAIDNVTRKLMHQGQRPVAVGFFFALGHSSIVAIVTVLVACLARAFEGFRNFQTVGGAVSTGVSAVFLISVGVANLAVFKSVYLRYRRSRKGAPGCHENESPLQAHGLVARMFGGLSKVITRSWQMFPLGFLFGLGFETATEVALFGLSATQADNGLPIGAILVYPALFAAGMLLLDTIDGVAMLGVYHWAFVKPTRKLYYNMAITLISALVAVLLGGLQAAAFFRSQHAVNGPIFRLLEFLGDKMGLWGVLIFLLLSGSWLVSWIIHRLAATTSVREGQTLSFRKRAGR